MSGAMLGMLGKTCSVTPSRNPDQPYHTPSELRV